MSASVKGSPAGTPSMTAVRPSPWDSPAVRKRNRKTPPLPAGRHRVGPEDRRRDEHHELAPGLEVLSLLEEPAEDRNVAHDRHLPHRALGDALGDAADDQTL